MILHHPRRARGFTLFEIMMAIGILVILGSVGWASMMNAAEMGEALAIGDETTRSARTALHRLRRDSPALLPHQ